MEICCSHRGPSVPWSILEVEEIMTPLINVCSFCKASGAVGYLSLGSECLDEFILCDRAGSGSSLITSQGDRTSAFQLSCMHLQATPSLQANRNTTITYHSEDTRSVPGQRSNHPDDCQWVRGSNTVNSCRGSSRPENHRLRR